MYEKAPLGRCRTGIICIVLSASLACLGFFAGPEDISHWRQPSLVSVQQPAGQVEGPHDGSLAGGTAAAPGNTSWLAGFTEAEMAAGAWIRSLGLREWKVFSQQGEDGILAAIVEALPVTSKYYVEFGVESGVERNTRALQERLGWSGLLMDGSHENAKLNLHMEFISAEGIVGLLQKHDVPRQFGLLSVDIDSYDWWVLKSILEGGYRPDVIVTEVNTQVERGRFTIAPANVTGAPTISADSFAFGATPEAFAALEAAFGYAMIYCEVRGVNCFAVKRGNLSEAYLPRDLHPPPFYSGSLVCRRQRKENVLPWYEIESDLSVKRTAVYPKPCAECTPTPREDDPGLLSPGLILTMSAVCFFVMVCTNCGRGAQPGDEAR